MIRATLLAVLAVCVFPTFARADGGWSIGKFDVAITIASDGTIDVRETILARFEEFKHGIFREIPVRYEVNGHLYDLRMHIREVTDERGNAWHYDWEDSGNRVVLKIGDAKKTIQGEHTYVIHYRIARAVLWEGEHAVLRWNATGTEWRVPIERSSVEVKLPAPLDDAQVQSDAWTGRTGERHKDFARTRVDAQTLRFTTRDLASTEGITVEVAMPATAITRPSFLSRLGWWLGDNFVYGLIPAWVGVGGLVWRLRGRDAEGMGAVVVNYEPPEGLGPAEVGTLADEKVDIRDVSAVLIDLAVRGYLTIAENRVHVPGWGHTSDYILTKKPKDGPLKSYERLVYDKVFENGDQVALSSLNTKLFEILRAVRSEIYGGLSSAGYFDGNPDMVRGGWLGAGLVVSAFALFAAAVVQMAWIGRLFWPPLIVTAVVMVVIVIVTSRVMPRRTRKGRIAWERIRGLEEFIRRAEVDDLKSQERRLVFERLLPYATAFSLTTLWAKAFEGLYTHPPSYYRPDGGGPFSMGDFGHSVDRAVWVMNRTIQSQPRSESSGSGSGGGWSSGSFGGGGSSGGGFGGGGGGSW